MVFSSANSDGSTNVSRDGEVIGGIAKPWAVDATGRMVETVFTVSGNTFQQKTVKSSYISYPLVADPWAGRALLKKAWVTQKTKTRYDVNAVPTRWGRAFNGLATHKAHVAELKAKLGKKRNKVTKTIDNQFICHVAGNISEPGTYNMESWRKNMHWAKQLNLKHKCNP